MKDSQTVTNLFNNFKHVADKNNGFADGHVETMFFLLFVEEAKAEKESGPSEKRSEDEKALSVQALDMLKTERPEVGQKIAKFILESFIEGVKKKQ